jgi:hypothetical protein
MANIPGSTNMIPGVYGPTSSEIIKTDKGYAIGFAPVGAWGKPHVEGSIREIAEQAFKIWATINHSNYGPGGPNIFGVLHISFKPITSVALPNNYTVHTDKIDSDHFLSELTKELDRLKVYLPFA